MARNRLTSKEVNTYAKRARGTSIREVAKEEGISPATVVRRTQKVEKATGITPEKILRRLMDELMEEAIEALKRGLQATEPSIVNQYFRGTGVYQEKSHLAVRDLTGLEDEEIADRIIKRLGLSEPG